jgi:hypothetical protein
MALNGAQIVASVRASVETKDKLGLLSRLAIFSVALFFFSNVAVHGFLFAGWPVRPAVIFSVITAVAAPFIYARLGLSFLGTAIGYWCVGFVAVASIWFIIFGADALPSVLGRCYAALFLLVFFALFTSHAEAVRMGRAALACGVLLAAACNAYEIVNPNAFLPQGFFYGRAAGFYVNPNQAGAAVVLGTVLGIGVVPKRFRAMFLAISFVAAAMTLSRAAIIGWCAVVGVLVLTNELRLRTAVAGLCMVAVAVYVGWILLADYLLETKGINIDLLRERVGFFTSINAGPDYSEIERARVAEKAWNLFEVNPFIGNGLGSTESWSDSASTHNMYLYFLADYGLIGAVIFPALILFAVRGNNRTARPYALALGCFAALWGLFSHNIVGELYSLLSFALVAAWVRIRDSDENGQAGSIAGPTAVRSGRQAADGSRRRRLRPP